MANARNLHHRRRQRRNIDTLGRWWTIFKPPLAGEDEGTVTNGAHPTSERISAVVSSSSPFRRNFKPPQQQKNQRRLWLGFSVLVFVGASCLVSKSTTYSMSNPSLLSKEPSYTVPIRKKEERLLNNSGLLMKVYNNNKKRKDQSAQLKRILFYTSYWNTPDFQFGIGQKPFQDYQCPISTCETVAMPPPLSKQQSSHPKDNASRTSMHTTRFSRQELGSNFDAVIFSLVFVDFKMTLELRHEINQWRRPNQNFVMFMMESPSYHIPNFDLHHYQNFFNWTMTYRWDSTFPRPYGWFQEKRNHYSSKQLQRNNNYNHNVSSPNQENIRRLPPIFQPIPPPKTWIPYNKTDFIAQLKRKQDQNPDDHQSLLALAQRPNKVAWIASNCETDSLREEYVMALRQYIQVDVYGKCHDMFSSPVHSTKRFGATLQGLNTTTTTTNNNNIINNPCNHPYSIYQTDNCTQHIETSYKFYLGFENTFCNEYLTEKYFRRVNTSVVIVLGQANYTRLVPPHSYINVLEYPSPNELANYLLYLDANDDEYLSYFWWKDYYTVHTAQIVDDAQKRHARDNAFGNSMCDVCAKLHQGEQQSPSTVVSTTEGRNSIPNSYDTMNAAPIMSPNHSSYDDIVQWWRGSAECGKLLPALKARLGSTSVKQQFANSHAIRPVRFRRPPRPAG